MKNQGISLISLIITIIVIIILAAIVIFTGLNTPDSAQFSAFCSDVDSVYMAVMNSFADVKVEHAISGDYRTNEQIYMEVAQGSTSGDKGQYAIMNTDSVKESSTASMATGGTGCININVDSNKLGMTLPKVREDRTHWYVLKDGRVFNETGFLYNNNTYWNASYYTKDEQVTTHSESRATSIATAMLDKDAPFEVSLISR